jgi:predicted nucleic acid-binding protein
LRTPSAAIILDAAILISAALGRSSRVILEAAQTRTLATTERALEEARRRITLGLRQPEILIVLEKVVQELTIVPMESLESLLNEAGSCLRDAVASRNGSVADAHVLALAWDAGADIWSADRDFAGTGVASWSTPNLMRALTEAGT